MSYSIEDEEGNFVLGDFSAKHLRKLSEVSGPRMKRFLDKGNATAVEVTQIVSELKTKINPGRDEKAFIRKLSKLKSGIRLYG